MAGRWTAAADAADFEVTDPATGLLAGSRSGTGRGRDGGRHRGGGRGLCRHGVTACHRSAPRILRRWGELMLANRGRPGALIMTLEQGKPLAESRGEIDYAAEFLDWYADEASG